MSMIQKECQLDIYNVQNDLTRKIKKINTQAIEECIYEDAYEW